MGLNVFSTKEQTLFYKHTLFVISILTLFFLAGCSSTGLRLPFPDLGTGLPEPEKIAPPDSSASGSRINASHSLTRDGYRLLCKKDYDGAIRLLEKAVGINPSDGPGYFYLSEAWIGKKNYKLAFQFNRLASIYLRENRRWAQRTQFQKKAIDSMR